MQHGGKAAVVDPGDASPVIEYLDREGIELCAIINTHHHGDHVGGNRGLLARWPVPVFGPAHEQIPGRTRRSGGGRHRARCRKSGSNFRFSISRATRPGTLRASATAWFSAETLCSRPAADGCSKERPRRWSHRSTSSPRSRPKRGSTADTSTRSRTFALRWRSNRAARPCRRVWSAIRRRATAVSRRFRRPSPRSARPIRFCAPSDPAIRAAAIDHAGRDLPDRVAVFAELRAWKNAF